MIQHISFDVWNTLITANPAFATARSQLLADRYGVPIELVRHEYTSLKRHADQTSEQNLVGLKTSALVRILIGSFADTPDDQEVVQVVHEIAELFRENPPSIEPNTINLIRELHDQGITVSIGSNSNFVSGRTMHPWLQEQFGEDMLAFGVYSDMFEVAKPSAAFFGRVIDFSTKVHGRNNISTHNMLHVGDSQLCDVWGPSQVGIKTLLITDPNMLYCCVNNYLKEATNV